MQGTQICKKLATGIQQKDPCSCISAEDTQLFTKTGLILFDPFSNNNRESCYNSEAEKPVCRCLMPKGRERAKCRQKKDFNNAAIKRARRKKQNHLKKSDSTE